MTGAKRVRRLEVGWVLERRSIFASAYTRDPWTWHLSLLWDFGRRPFVHFQRPAK